MFGMARIAGGLAEERRTKLYQWIFLAWLFIVNALYYWQFRELVMARMGWLLRLWAS